LSLSGNILSGAPTTAGFYSTIVKATDTVTGLSTQTTLTLTVYSLPFITTTSLPSGTAGVAYTATLAASGGSGTYTWSLSGLPAGITNNGPSLSGTPTTAVTSTVTITIGDQLTGASTQKSLSVVISKSAVTTHYMSDLTPTKVFNSWGTMQKDLSIAGNPISLNGVRYAKGVGGHAYSEVSYAVNGGCSTLTATTGIDDEIPAGSGSLYFQVWADGLLLYSGPTLQGGSKAVPVSVDVSGRQVVSLVATNGIFMAPYWWQVNNDHADWADAKLVCTW